MSSALTAENAPPAECDGPSHPSGEQEPSLTWRERLYARFRGQPHPLFVFEEGVLPAASAWAGARIWSAAFRDIGLQSGDRIAVSLPPSPAFLYVLIASLWNDLTLALLPAGQEAGSAVSLLDARCCIGNTGLDCAWPVDACGLPDAFPRALRRTCSPPTPDARLLLATSGTTSAQNKAGSRWIALSDRNLFSVLDSHAPLLNLENARLLSLLPWNHAFGLILDLLPAMFAGAEITRERTGGREPERVAAQMSEYDITHLNGVPLQIERLARVPGGLEALQRLRGGVVGGAAVSASLAGLLSSTRLRAGYGQTEASPGITMGQPGEWKANLLGSPVGCQTRVDAQGVLAFQGANACLGVWQNGALTRLPAERWVVTGDTRTAGGAPPVFHRTRAGQFQTE